MNTHSIPSPVGITGTIGFFDGVHRGHQFLLQQVRAAAAERGAQVKVFTFRDHPLRVVRGVEVPLVSDFDDKVRRIAGHAGCAPGDVVTLPFTPALAAQTARQFMENLMRGHGVTALVMGYDHRFGRPQGETFADYVRMGQELGLEIVLAREYADGGERICSSAIRSHILAGRVAEANQMLGHPLSYAGRVAHGEAVGRTLGFPTANLADIQPGRIFPPNGGYAVRVRDLDDGTLSAGMLYIGSRPTFHQAVGRTVEVHLFDRQANLYNHRLTVDVLQFLRGEERFPTPEALVEQLRRDADRAKAITSVL